MFATLRNDIRVVFERDPAARTLLEVLFNYPGLHAVWGHRISHWLWIHGFKFLGRWVSQWFRGFTGIEIHPGATIGPGLFIDHGMGVVIGETAEVGCDVTLYHCVTLGGTSLNKGKRHPTLGDRVVVGAGAKVLGNIIVGDDTRIGANAVVVKSVPSDSIVVGVPGQPVARSRPRTGMDSPDLNHTLMPDMIGASVISLMSRMDALEKVVTGHSAPSPVHQPDHGTWHGEDFAI